MEAREITSPWSMTDSRNGHRAEGDFSTYAVAADTPEVEIPKATPAVESVESSDSPKSSAVIPGSSVNAEKESNQSVHQNQLKLDL